ncbi:hypothetical protein SDC9_113924 [bioreactor metagenome]|uniref:Uncharacterized protein n=1 Tax=bioreactor metagenome TaxID=1076179 RepID=A0A645BNH0_9ZZZZ
MAFLGQLCRFQVFVALLEIGAGVLALAVQKQLIEPVVQIVVMRHVGTRFAAQIVLQQGPQLHAPGIEHAYRGADGHMPGAAQHQLQHVVDRALLDQQALLHEQLAKVEVGVAQQRKDGASVGKAQARLGLAVVAEDQRLA